jgi:hypothetical protein
LAAYALDNDGAAWAFADCGLRAFISWTDDLAKLQARLGKSLIFIAG